MTIFDYGFWIFVALLVLLNVALLYKYFAIKNEANNFKTNLTKQVESETLDLQKKYETHLKSAKNQVQKEVETRLTEKFQTDLARREYETLKVSQIQEDRLRAEILEIQRILDRKENTLEERDTKIESLRDDLNQLQVSTNSKTKILDIEIQKYQVLNVDLADEYKQKLAEVSGLTTDEAYTLVKKEKEKEMGEELLQWQNKYLAQFEQDAYQKAKEIASLAIQRCSSEVANELTITAVKIDNEADKGKLIGKQGRNIQWLEKTLGVELIIDDTPNIITVSGFSSIRRNIAKNTIEKLLIDGRIHPSSIEEMYEKASGEVRQEIYEAGQWAVNELGIYDFPEKLIRLLGRLIFRTGYGQNVLKHSVEMARIAGLIADSLNAEFPTKTSIDKLVCIKGALLHDIGKAVDEEMTPKGNHIQIGEKLCDLYNLGWKVRRCISSHHTTGGDRQSYFDTEHNELCLEAAVVDACDTLSGARPGARKESMEAYFQRMEALENVANKIDGVTKTWIMRGAKELWVFFDANMLTSSEIHTATRTLAREINNTIKTPQEIKVIGFREDRVVEYTR